MPLARYFLFVGAALLALLFVSDAYFPKLPDAVSADNGVDKATIRIRSDRKWPQAVVFDTNRPTLVPAPVAVAQDRVPAATVADVSAKARDAFAQAQPPDHSQVQLSVQGKPEPIPQHKRRVAKRRAPPVMLVAQQPAYGLFGNNTW